MHPYKGRHIQWVTFAVPFPPDYGGAIDVFYKIKTLAEMGVKIHLHAFEYRDFKRSEELEQYCEKVYYYPRNPWWKSLKIIPYIVSSRMNQDLMNNILSLRHPVILEGLHTAYLLPFLEDNKIQSVIRMHNVEWKYYQFLYKNENTFIFRQYFKNEAQLLRKFEKIVSAKTPILSISDADTDYYSANFPQNNVTYLPAFHGMQFNVEAGRGDYALFNGNLDVNENRSSAEYLLKLLKNNADKLIIAGKNAGKFSFKEGEKRLAFFNLKKDEMDTLMENAHIHMIPNQQPTGIKIKWINALFSARFIIVGKDILQKSMPEMGVYVADSDADWAYLFQLLMQQECTPEMVQLRKKWLSERFDNHKNALILLRCLFESPA